MIVPWCQQDDLTREGLYWYSLFSMHSSSEGIQPDLSAYCSVKKSVVANGGISRQCMRVDVGALVRQKRQ